MKFPIYSQVIKKRKSWKKSDQLQRLKISSKREHHLSFIASLFRNAKEICILFWALVQLESLSERE